MIGRLSPEKRQKVLIDAIRHSKFADKIQLHLAGNGPCKKKLMEQGKELKHQPTFGFYSKEELIQLIHACDLYVLSLIHIFISFTPGSGQREVEATSIDLADAGLDALIGADKRGKLVEEIELLDGASHEFDMELVRAGQLSPVFFGSALTNFGVEPFLKEFLRMTTSPLPLETDSGTIDPFSPYFTAFVFKIQANMNKAQDV